RDLSRTSTTVWSRIRPTTPAREPPIHPAPHVVARYDLQRPYTLGRFYAEERADVRRGADCGTAARTARLVLRKRVDSPCLQDRRLADDARARHHHRLLRGGGIPPSRPRGDLCKGDGQAADAQRRRDYRQGLRARTPTRGGRALASEAGWGA